MMAIVSGTVCVAADLARLDFITDLLSKPIRYGYMNGIALTVLLSQLPKLFGFSVKTKGPLRQAWGISEKVLAGDTNVMALVIGAGTLAVILFLQRRPRIPGILIAVVAATVVVAAFHLETRAGVSVLGPLSRGLPNYNSLLSASTTFYRFSRVALPLHWSRSQTRACSPEPMRRACIHMSTPTRRWSASASPTSPQPSFRDSPSAAVPLALP
jgi:MFS superfamily sulfate permease-like transporter